MPAEGVTESRFKEICYTVEAQQSHVVHSVESNNDKGSVYQPVEYTEEEKEVIRERRKNKKLQKKVEKEHNRRLERENALKDSKIKVIKLDQKVSVVNTANEFLVSLQDFPEYGKPRFERIKNVHTKTTSIKREGNADIPQTSYSEPTAILSCSNATASEKPTSKTSKPVRVTDASVNNTKPRAASKTKKVKSSHPTQLDLASLLTVKRKTPSVGKAKGASQSAVLSSSVAKPKVAKASFNTVRVKKCLVANVPRQKGQRKARPTAVQKWRKLESREVRKDELLSLLKEESSPAFAVEEESEAPVESSCSEKKSGEDVRQEVIHELTELSKQSSVKCSTELTELLASILSQLAFFQRRQHRTDPRKDKAKRRLVFGLRETKNKLHRIKTIVLAEETMKQSVAVPVLQTLTEELIIGAEGRSIPVVHSGMSRFRLGRVVGGVANGRVGCVGVLSWEGCEQGAKQVAELLSGGAAAV